MRVPTSRPSTTLLDELEGDSNTRQSSKSGHAGSGSDSMFPSPMTLTVSCTGSLTFPVVLSTSAEMLNLPTAPVNPAGAVVGRGCTSMTMESDSR